MSKLIPSPHHLDDEAFPDDEPQPVRHLEGAERGHLVSMLATLILTDLDAQPSPTPET